MCVCVLCVADGAVQLAVCARIQFVQVSVHSAIGPFDFHLKLII